jgi:hypothetical protein
MPRVVPSQIVAVAEKRFTNILGPGQGTAVMFRPWLRGIVTLVDRVPSELLPVNPADFAELIAAVEVLRDVCEEKGPARNFSSIERSAIRDLHRLLQACPDEAPSADTSDPVFIDDLDLRADLHRDLGEVNRALSDGEWKGATVLAGSVVEALVLWALKNRRTDVEIQDAATRLGKTMDLQRKPLEQWGLGELIEYAHATALISSETRAAAELGKDFRNLIHPGRAARLSKRCDRSTALFGVGAVEAVIANLARPPS